MRRYRIFVGVGMFLSWWSAPCVAQGRICSDGVVEVRSAVGQVSEVVVEAGVADLVRSGDPATIKVEHSAGHLFITPLSVDPAVLTIIDQRGHSYRIRQVFGDEVDAKITIADCQPSPDGKRQEDQVMQMMRQLLRGRVPDGFGREVDKLMFEDERWQMRCIQVYEQPSLWGYLAIIKSKAVVPMLVPLQQMRFPGLLAVAADQDMIPPGSEGHVYMVIRR